MSMSTAEDESAHEIIGSFIFTAKENQHVVARAQERTEKALIRRTHCYGHVDSHLHVIESKL